MDWTFCTTRKFRETIIENNHWTWFFFLFFLLLNIFFYVISHQTVKSQEAEMKETKSDLESDTVSVAAEPEQHLDPHTDLNLQIDTQDNNQEIPKSSTPESVPAQDQVSTDDPAPAKLFSDAPDAHLSLESQPAASQDEAENAPTSRSASQTHTG